MRNSFGYILGFLVFVAGIPALMWLVSGRPFPWVPSLPWAVLAVALMIIGLSLSIWSIVHMKKVGEGNPFDAYNHELAPRTKHLMTDGPYKYTRNNQFHGIYLSDESRPQNGGESSGGGEMDIDGVRLFDLKHFLLKVVGIGVGVFGVSE